jgi:hypothetical protein
MIFASLAKETMLNCVGVARLAAALFATRLFGWINCAWTCGHV